MLPDAEGRKLPAEAVGVAHVGAASFLASRLVPTGGFWVALAGGVALARAAQRHGARIGYGASMAAMLQTVAIMGPVRFGVPLTQAMSAPLMGALEARGASRLAQFAACALIRILSNALLAAFFILVLVGGPEAYAGPLDWLNDRVGLVPSGPAGALILTGIGLLFWAAFASSVQVWVYLRGLRNWPGDAVYESDGVDRIRRSDAAVAWDPRALAGAAVVAWVALLAQVEWALLAAVAVWLVLAAAATRGERDVTVVGAIIALVLGLGVGIFTLTAGLGADLALRRALRAVLLVLVATWLRGAAGEPGLRELARRTLGRLRRVPSAVEAEWVLERLGHGRELGPAARSLADAVRPANHAVAFVDTVLGWTAAEAGRFRHHEPGTPPPLRFRARDAVVLVAAVAAAVAGLAL